MWTDGKKIDKTLRTPPLIILRPIPSSIFISSVHKNDFHLNKNIVTLKVICLVLLSKHQIKTAVFNY